MPEAVSLLVGTHKGAFVVRGDATHRQWEIEGPTLKGLPVEYGVADPRDGLLYATVTHPFYGPKLHRSADGGRTWEEIGAPRFTPGDTTVPLGGGGGNATVLGGGGGQRTVERIWVIQPGPSSEPKRLYAGVAPAALFTSTDGGETWDEVPGLNQHATRDQWQPGKGGMCLHTILQDPGRPQRIFVAISAAGVFYTEDGGQNWQVRSQGVRAEFLPNPYPEVGQCIHKIAMHPQRPDVIFLQNHGGVYRSEDSGQTWSTIEAGLPAVFGFPIAVHPTQPETVFIFPMAADAERYNPGGHPAVYRRRDSGQTWQALRNGLPTDEAWFTVLRQAMATDTLSQAGVYFGTTTGQLYAGRDDGERWSLVTANLPPIYSVRTLVA